LKWPFKEIDFERGPPKEFSLNFDSDCLFIIITKGYIPKAKPLLRSLTETNLDIPVILVIEKCNPVETYSLLKLGIADFITPPFNSIDILPRLWRILDQKKQSADTTHKLKERLGLKQLIGESPIFLDVVNIIPTVAKCDASVLISGETGTGKELFARAIHYLSLRSDKPFVPINCGAIPTELLENELFGHVRGAFTGASRSHLGLVYQAENGTLFLDDIACLSITSQAKLLRFLQEKEYRQLGTVKASQSDTRVIATTNIDLAEAVEKGTFRKDLYYRLNTIPLSLPSLRERSEDIPILARHFLDKYTIKYKKEISDFSPGAMRKLVLYE
jgi:DNA-binding NtrC family response regulator